LIAFQTGGGCFGQFFGGGGQTLLNLHIFAARDFKHAKKKNVSTEKNCNASKNLGYINRVVFRTLDQENFEE
jgi:hypothetical protein